MGSTNGVGRCKLIIFHLEATNDIETLFSKIQEAGMKVGIGIKLQTPVNDLIQNVDL